MIPSSTTTTRTAGGAGGVGGGGGVVVGSGAGGPQRNVSDRHVVDSLIRSVSSVFLQEHIPPGLQYRHSEELGGGTEQMIPPSIRLVSRTGPFRQSAETVFIDFRWTEAFANARMDLFRLIARDLFHYMISLPKWGLILTLTLIYTFQIIIFAAFYVWVDRDCPSTPEMSYQYAFAFSLETSTTVGFTLPFSNDDMFFGGCVSWLVVIYLQLIITMVLNAVIVGIVLIRVSRADRRALKVVFTDKACIVCIRGKYYFMFQVFDLDGELPVVSAQVRMYAVFHETSSSMTAHFQTRVMRTLHPDDQIGGKLFLSVPSTVIHHLDIWSPLMPPKLVQLIPGIGTSPDEAIRNSSTRPSFPGHLLREADGSTGARMTSCCPACGETFLNYQYLVRHIEFNRQVEESRGDTFWGKSSHASIDVALLNTKCTFVPHAAPEKNTDLLTTASSQNQTPSSTESNQYGDDPRTTNTPKLGSTTQVGIEEAKARILEHIEETKLEIIVLVEGIDPRTSNSFQSRHSYCASDIVFDQLFVPCLSVSKTGTAEVDLKNFHKTTPVPEFINEPPPVASHS